MHSLQAEGVIICLFFIAFYYEKSTPLKKNVLLNVVCGRMDDVDFSSIQVSMMYDMRSTLTEIGFLHFRLLQYSQRRVLCDFTIKIILAGSNSKAGNN